MKTWVPAIRLCEAGSLAYLQLCTQRLDLIANACLSALNQLHIMTDSWVRMGMSGTGVAIARGGNPWCKGETGGIECGSKAAALAGRTSKSWVRKKERKATPTAWFVDDSGVMGPSSLSCALASRYCTVLCSYRYVHESMCASKMT